MKVFSFSSAYIGQSALSTCMNLKSIVVPENSELQEFYCGVFSHTKIESFTIPPHITAISAYAFLSCDKLKKIEFAPNSEIKRIEIEALRFTKIESFTIPSTLVELDDGW